MNRKGRGSRVHYGWVVIFTGMLATIAAHGFGRMSYTLILPEMREGLGLTYTQAGLLSTGNFIGYLLFAVIGGFLASRYGARRVISLSLVLMGMISTARPDPLGCVLLVALALLLLWLSGVIRWLFRSYLVVIFPMLLSLFLSWIVLNPNPGTRILFSHQTYSGVSSSDTTSSLSSSTGA